MPNTLRQSFLEDARETSPGMDYFSWIIMRVLVSPAFLLTTGKLPFGSGLHDSWLDLNEPYRAAPAAG